eukprot:2842020-Pleurochrysis_carterae.AAC.4
MSVLRNWPHLCGGAPTSSTEANGLRSRTPPGCFTTCTSEERTIRLAAAMRTGAERQGLSESTPGSCETGRGQGVWRKHDGGEGLKGNRRGATERRLNRRGRKGRREQGRKGGKGGGTYKGKGIRKGRTDGRSV